MITREEAKQDLLQKLHLGILKIGEYVDKLFDQQDQLQQQNDIFRKVIKEREEQDTINHEKWEKFCLELQQHIKSLEAQLSNTEQLTCESCVFCNHYSTNGYECLKLPFTDDYGDEDFFEVKKDFYCNKYTSKDTQ